VGFAYTYIYKLTNPNYFFTLRGQQLLRVEIPPPQPPKKGNYEIKLVYDAFPGHTIAGGQVYLTRGEFGDQGDAEWIVIRRLLWGSA
jgi:hypothetical protein